MTIEDIEVRIKEIRREAHDCESAHSLEDSLRLEFIEYIATLEGLPSLAAKAKLVASTEGIEFKRWYA